MRERFDAQTMRISTHTPHARRDTSWAILERLLTPFQLTRLMRGVTKEIG